MVDDNKLNRDEFNLILDVKDRDTNSDLGLIIKNIKSEQRHTGFIFFENDEYTLAHFGWHRKYFYQKWELSNKYAMYWMSLDIIPEETSLNILSTLRLIAENNAPLSTCVFEVNASYGITGCGNTQIVSGTFQNTSGVPMNSFTCATFVNFIFEQCGFSILDLDSWELTEEDKIWQAEIIDLLEASDGVFLPEFIETQRSQIGKVPRVRPEQMVGACCIFDMTEPVNYQKAERAGEIVLEKLRLLDV